MVFAHYKASDGFVLRAYISLASSGAHESWSRRKSSADGVAYTPGMSSDTFQDIIMRLDRYWAARAA